MVDIVAAMGAVSAWCRLTHADAVQTIIEDGSFVDYVRLLLKELDAQAAALARGDGIRVPGEETRAEATEAEVERLRVQVKVLETEVTRLKAHIEKLRDYDCGA
jgi:ubiquinone biosynthesis protein UbiJ